METESSEQKHSFDKVPEERMAEMLGTTKRALEGKRARGVIPEGVWNKIDGRIFYSVRRYEEWQESVWDCPRELSLLVNPSASGSPGSAKGAAKPSRSHRRPRASNPQQIYVLT